MADERRREKGLWIAAGKAQLRGSWGVGTALTSQPSALWGLHVGAASPGLGDSAAAVSFHPWIPTQRIQQQPGGLGGGEEPAGRGAEHLPARASPFSLQLRPGCARPLSPQALWTRALPSRTPDVPAASHPFAHTHPAAAMTSVHLFTPRYVWGTN